MCTRFSKRDVIKLVLNGNEPPYVPWSIGLTSEAKKKLQSHSGEDIESLLQNHLLKLGSDIGFFEQISDNIFRDVFGVQWNRTIDKDIGLPANVVLIEPSLKNYNFPDPLDKRFFDNIPSQILKFPDRFRVFQIGFSLYERAWSLRGMENLLIDFVENPRFVRDLLNAIADYNIAQINEALEYDIDAVYFGDDWGQQHGLQMGPKIWREFIRPVLKRMYEVVRSACKYVMIHSCGDVDELFPDLVEIGLNCFNPFQPEVMDIYDLLKQYRGRLSFHGGLSTQKTLPFGSIQDVKDETMLLLQAGKKGNYIFAPAHDITRDVPLENMLTFIDILKKQPLYKAS
jgi:uroporphyrinogen decarboxylase